MPPRARAGSVSGVRRLRATYKSFDPVHVDVLVAALLVVAGVLAAVFSSDAVSLAPRLCGVVGIAAAVAIRRRRPVAAAMVVGVSFVSASALGGAPSKATGVVALAAIVACVYTLGARVAGWRLVAATAVLLASFVTDAFVEQSDLLGSIAFFSIFVLALPLAAGRATRNRARLANELSDRARALERVREAEAQAAVQDERARIARELHDVVAHDVSVMVVQAAAAKRLVERQPDRAEEAIGSIEGTGREALTEMRRLLGVLRRGDEDLALAPQPRLGRVEDLLARTRQAGLRVDLERSGSAAPLPAGVDLAAYRVVQEALANVVRHAGAARATVRLAYEPRAVEVEVLDDGAGGINGAPPGHGLRGLHERVDLYGGDFEAGPGEHGGFRVRARLPVNGGSG